MPLTMNTIEQLAPFIGDGRFCCPFGKCLETFKRKEDWICHVIQEHQERLRHVDQVAVMISEEEKQTFSRYYELRRPCPAERIRPKD